MSVSKLARLTQRKTAVCVTNDLFQWSQVRGRKKKQERAQETENIEEKRTEGKT